MGKILFPQFLCGNAVRRFLPKSPQKKSTDTPSTPQKKEGKYFKKK